MKASINQRLYTSVQDAQKIFTLASPKRISMRAIDAKILEGIEMVYGDKDCFASLQDWFGAAEAYKANLERLFIVADYAKKHNPSAAEEITSYNKRIIELFHQTKKYASGWNSNHKEKRRLSTRDYTEASNESWDALNKWTVTQQKLRQAILEFIDLLYSVVSKP
jgi:hypothetical protein